jgi:hypothetical protein
MSKRKKRKGEGSSQKDVHVNLSSVTYYEGDLEFLAHKSGKITGPTP